MPLESERKYLDPDLAVLRDLLTRLGAKSQGPRFETNLVFDTPDFALYRAKKLLRLRLEQWAGGARCLLTFKLPLEDVPDIPGIKMREEKETCVESFETAREILGQLGYLEAMVYEKFRESWFYEAESPVHVDMDILPFGQVVEIEAPPAVMDRVAARLGLDKFKISSKNYHELYQDWRQMHGLPPQTGFSFSPPEKTRLQRSLGLQVRPGPGFPARQIPNLNVEQAECQATSQDSLTVRQKSFLKKN